MNYPHQHNGSWASSAFGSARGYDVVAGSGTGGPGHDYDQPACGRANDGSFYPEPVRYALQEFRTTYEIGYDGNIPTSK
ncbi:hypothetical protein CVT26_015189, partial [Gymnopilus dilepis]